MKKSKIYIEKFDHRPGIYIIFNFKSHKLYIGKSTRMKERVLQHVKNLYLNCDNNANLQQEFSNTSNTYYIGCLKQFKNFDNLDKWESIFYLAAINLFGKDMIYNTVSLNSERKQINEITEAKKIIKSALSRKLKGTEPYSCKRCSQMQDWIPTDLVNKLCLEKISIKKLFYENKLDCLLLGKAGDYIGNGHAQTISEILEEKICELNQYKEKNKRKCLWATSGPTLKDFSAFQAYFNNNFEESEKMYVLFKLTINPYNNSKSESKKYFWENNGIKYYDTAPEANTVKALVIKNFYVVEENFQFEQLAKMYYRYSSPAYYSSTKRYILNSDSLSRSTLYPAVSNSSILDNSNNELRNNLGFSKHPYLLDEFKKRCAMYNGSVFPTCSEDEHPFYYILAEVENYVTLQTNE